MKKLILIFILILFPFTASALEILKGQQGGTGIGSATSGDVGNCLQVSSVGPLVWTLGACSGGSGTSAGNSKWATSTTDSTSIYMVGTGNAGIGTSSPYSKLSVVGTTTAMIFEATSTTATSTFNGNIRVDGNIDTNMTAGSILYAGTSGVINQSNSTLFFDSTNKRLLIGTSAFGTAPQTTLHLGYDTNGDSIMRGERIDTSRYALMGFYSGGTEEWSFGVRGSGEGFGNDLLFRDNAGTIPFRLGKTATGLSSFTGKLGIGTSSPYSMLSVAGQVVAQNLIATSTNATSTIGGEIRTNVNNNYSVIIGGLDVAPTSFAGIWLGQSNAQASNYAFLGQAGQTFFNVENGGTADMEFRVGNATKFTVGNSGAGILLTPNIAPTKPFQVNLTSGGTQAFNVESTGDVGIGSTSPYAKLSVVQDAITPELYISTSTGVSSLLFVNATSTGLSNNYGTSTASGVHVSIGTPMSIPTDNEFAFHQLFTNGTMSSSYQEIDCYRSTNVSADTGAICSGNWSFNEDNDMNLGVSVGTNDFAHRINNVSATANDGASMYFSPTSTGDWMYGVATSAPIMEGLIKIDPNATGTNYYFGITDRGANDSTLELPPVAGCYLTASSTKATWQAVCSTSASATTIVDMGVASSTVVGGTLEQGRFYKLFVKANANFADFGIALGDSNQLIAYRRITTNIPNTTAVALSPTLYYGWVKASIANSRNLFFKYLKLWTLRTDTI